MRAVERQRLTLRSGRNLAAQRRSQGFSLIEIVIVVALMGLIAAIAIPGLGTSDAYKLDLAASEVAAAVRFAHSEAIRTGQPHGVYATKASQKVRVYRLSPAFVRIYDVNDPLTKQPYDLIFSTKASDVTIDDAYFKFDGFSSPTASLGFSGGTGLPKYKVSGTIGMLESGYIRLGYRGALRTVRISPMTGRVTMQ